MEILIVHFSHTGNTAQVAEHISAGLAAAGSLTRARIRPRRQHGYWGWLLRSLVPGWSVAIEPTILDLAPYDLVCLGFPKWSFACPPLNEFLKRMKGCRGKKFALFMTYGGFDEDRYLRQLTRRLSQKGVQITGQLKVRRRNLDAPETARSIVSFCDELRRATES